MHTDLLIKILKNIDIKNYVKKSRFFVPVAQIVILKRLR